MIGTTFASSALALIVLTCPRTRVLGGKPDPAVFDRAEEICATRYAGCMVEIRKTGEKSYKVICKRHRRED